MTLERVEEALWSVYTDLREEAIDEDQAEALTNILDSLMHIHEIQSRQQRIEERLQKERTI